MVRSGVKMVRSGVKMVRSGVPAVLSGVQAVLGRTSDDSEIKLRVTSLNVEHQAAVCGELKHDSLKPTTTLMCSCFNDNNFTTSSLKVLVTS